LTLLGCGDTTDETCGSGLPNCGTVFGGRRERSSLMKASITLALLAVVAILVPSSVKADATTTSRVFSYPVEFTTFVNCLNGGAGEWIALTGSVQSVYVSTTDSTGSQHIEELSIQQGISGVGLTSGDVYRTVGAHRSGFNAQYQGLQSEIDVVNDYRLIRAGGGVVLAVHETSHVTRNANGDVTAHVENFSIVCEGQQLG
jgi:hypothetical protein